MRVLEWISEHAVKIIIAIVMMIVTGVIALVIIASVENESNRINERTVIDKHYSNAYTTVNYTKVGDTTIPQNVYHPESYKLEIQGEKDGEIVTYWFECTAEEYQQYKIGDYYRK